MPSAEAFTRGVGEVETSRIMDRDDEDPGEFALGGAESRMRPVRGDSGAVRCC